MILQHKLAYIGVQWRQIYRGGHRGFVEHVGSMRGQSRFPVVGLHWVEFKLSCIAHLLSCPRSTLFWPRRQRDENGDRAAIEVLLFVKFFCSLWRTLQLARSPVNFSCSVLRSDFERSSENFRSDRLCISVRLRIHKSLALLCMLASCKCQRLTSL